MGNETFKKREKEAARREKQQKKAARRIERKSEKVKPEKEDVEAERPLLEAGQKGLRYKAREEPTSAGVLERTSSEEVERNEVDEPFSPAESRHQVAAVDE